MTTTPLPGASAPELNVDLVGGGSFKLADASPENFTMVVFYRGAHCPVCKSYNRELDGLVDDLHDLGVEPIAVSMDTEQATTTSVDDWAIEHVPVGYGLSEQAARDWGLYLSSAIEDGEPELFSEPALFLVTPDGDLFYAAVNSMPWGRPDLETLVKSIGWVLDNDYPSRGRVS